MKKMTTEQLKAGQELVKEIESVSENVEKMRLIVSDSYVERDIEMHWSSSFLGNIPKELTKAVAQLILSFEIKRLESLQNEFNKL